MTATKTATAEPPQQGGGTWEQLASTLSKPGVLAAILGGTLASGAAGGYLSSRARPIDNESRRARRGRIIRDALLSAATGGAATGAGAVGADMVGHADTGGGATHDMLTGPLARIGGALMGHMGTSMAGLKSRRNAAITALKELSALGSMKGLTKTIDPESAIATLRAAVGHAQRTATAGIPKHMFSMSPGVSSIYRAGVNPYGPLAEHMSPRALAGFLRARGGRLLGGAAGAFLPEIARGAGGVADFVGNAFSSGMKGTAQ